MQKSISRRQACGQVVAGSVSLALALTPFKAALAQNKVDPNGPLAQGLGYTEDASGAARAASDHSCATCLQFTGGSEAWGGCNIFAGDLVAANGWCSAFVKRG